MNLHPQSNARSLTHRRAAWLPCAVGVATLTVVVAFGHDGRRIAQLMALALPPLLWLAWPIRDPRLHRFRSAAVWFWAMAFALDGVVRAYLFDTYRAAPDSSLVQSAAANTNGREMIEYLSTTWRSMAVWTGAVLAAGLIFGRLVHKGARISRRWSGMAVAVLSLMLVTSSIAYLSKPWRRLHPVFFWTSWSESVDALRAGWADQQKERDVAHSRARSVSPIVTRKGPATVVLVITDSINRDNMALYGYKRATTPRLLAHKAQLGDQMLVMRNAWSVDASTLPSLRNILNFGEPDGQKPQHVMALARAAGYKVWWMSNHDDVAIEQQHGKLADVVEMVNRTPGRAGASLDGELLDCVQEAMEDPAERKLIVVHLMGAHPHYRLRFPEGANPFDHQPDDVEEGMDKAGRSAWVRQFRQEYDAAMLYHDFVVSETLQIARNVGRPDEYRAWMYLSDHGQEVGHSGNHAGHSPQTASGYRIPTVVWRHGPPSPNAAATEVRPFRADWAAWTLADLLQLSWQRDHNNRNALADDYQWAAPSLPVDVGTFRD